MRSLAASLVLLGLSGVPAAAEDAPTPLRLTVSPSGYDEGESLDAMLARRERGFRFICIGCLRMPDQPDSGAPFEPIRTLNAPQLTRAIAAEAVPFSAIGTPPD